MKIIHRVSLVDAPQRREALSSLGIKFGAPESPLVKILWFDIEEGDSSWCQVRDLILKWNIEDGCDPNNLGFVNTKFTEKELDDANFLQTFAQLHGYPQPAGDFGYLKATYDLTQFCAACGTGKKQIAPFRMKGEPKWGKKNAFQLNWVYDEFFVQPAIWEDVFRPLGIGRLAVLDHRSGSELQTVVQLEIKAIAKSRLLLDDSYPTETCATCGRKKYNGINRGFYPAFASDPGFQIGRTQEIFGSGGSAWNATIVSQAVYKAIQAQKVVGFHFYPLEN
jgi:hypothetical protein